MSRSERTFLEFDLLLLLLLLHSIDLEVSPGMLMNEQPNSN